MDTNLPARRRNRLKDYDYSTPGAYFITVCTRGRARILSRVQFSSNDTMIPLMVRAIKTNVSRQTGRSIWQDSFYDHIIRSEADYLAITQYIDENPLKWALRSLLQEGTS